MLARVKQDYAAGSVMAFSGREYVRSEWREVPTGFEEQAKIHPLLEVQPSLDEIRAKGPTELGLVEPGPETPAVTAVTEESPAETPAEEPPAEEPPAEETISPKATRRRKRAAGTDT